MVIDGNSLSHSFNEVKTDYCIIGTGIGGGALLKELSDNGAEVVCLESGNYNPNEDYSSLILHQGMPFRIDQTYSTSIGGTSNLWNGVLAPLDPIDFEVRSWIEHSGWPIKEEEIRKYYPRANSYLGSNGTFDHYNIDKIDEDQREKFELFLFNRAVAENKLFQKSTPVFSTKETVIKNSENSTSIHCYYNTTVEELISNDNGKICGIKAFNQNQKEINVIANHYVVCAGALHTPRILLNSKISMPLPAIGKYFMDHPRGVFTQVRHKLKQNIRHYSDLRYESNLSSKSGIIQRRETQYKYELLNHNFYFQPSFTRNLPGKTEIIRKSLIEVMSKNFRPQYFKNILLNPLASLFLMGYRFELLNKHRYSDLFFVTEQIPNPESKIELTSVRNVNGYRLGEIKWKLTNQDIESMSRSFQILKKETLTNEYFELTTDVKDVDWSSRLTSAAHHMGTARMGTNTNYAVVDDHLNVFNTPNLYICDASVFPTGGNVNPSLTVAALAIRLAQHIITK